MADHWTITRADSIAINIDVEVSGVTTGLEILFSDIDSSNSTDLLSSLRDIATSYRQSIIDHETPPSVANSLVGHSEDF